MAALSINLIRSDALPPNKLNATIFEDPSIQVLLVEDDPDTADLVRNCLDESGDGPFEVEWVPSLSDAVIRLAQPGVAVVILDLGLPELTGYKSFRVIEAAAGRRVPVVVFTADACELSKTLVQGRDASEGPVEYLVKQESTPEELRRAVWRAAKKGAA
jgi:CheY-like chemotaxis protein